MIDEKKLIECLRHDISCFETNDMKDNEMYVRVDDMIRMIEGQPQVGVWIPCKERLPETVEYMEFEPTPYMKRLEIAYMTDTVEYLIGFYDGSKWMDKRHNIIKNVIAWKSFVKLTGV